MFYLQNYVADIFRANTPFPVGSLFRSTDFTTAETYSKPQNEITA